MKKNLLLVVFLLSSFNISCSQPALKVYSKKISVIQEECKRLGIPRLDAGDLAVLVSGLQVKKKTAGGQEVLFLLKK